MSKRYIMVHSGDVVPDESSAMTRSSSACETGIRTSIEGTAYRCIVGYISCTGTRSIFNSWQHMQVITITGTGFDESNIDAHRVWVGPKQCYVRAVTSNTITCRARGGGTFGSLAIFALVGSQFASGSLSVTGVLEINSISHDRGSLQGGSILTIDGAGFAVEGSVFSNNLVSIGV